MRLIKKGTLYSHISEEIIERKFNMVIHEHTCYDVAR